MRPTMAAAAMRTNPNTTAENTDTSWVSAAAATLDCTLRVGVVVASGKMGGKMRLARRTTEGDAYGSNWETVV